MSAPHNVTLDGNEAVAYTAYRVNEVCAIYPITPSSTMAELADQWSAAGKTNLWGEVPRIRGWMDRLLALWSEGVVRPHVDKVFPFRDAAAAHHYVQDRRNVGKVLLKP